jgi:hypothetical protein
VARLTRFAWRATFFECADRVQQNASSTASPADRVLRRRAPFALARQITEARRVGSCVRRRPPHLAQGICTHGHERWFRRQGPAPLSVSGKHDPRGCRHLTHRPATQGYFTELERLGYTHLEMRCATCGHVGTKSFFLLRTRGIITDETTFPAVVERIRCAKCRRKLPSKLIRPLHSTERAGAHVPKKLRRQVAAAKRRAAGS